jgi:guanylate kinase
VLGKLVIFSAPSGSGKTTIVQHLVKRFPELEFSVSACSREIRKGEAHGVNYYFLTVEDFKARIKNDEFVEWQEVYDDHFYGTLKSEILRIWSHGKHVIFDVDVEGGLNLKKQFGDNALAIFVKAPSIAHLEARLRGRETETDESIARRMAKAEKEMKVADRFDVILMNENLDVALGEAERIVGDFLKK